MFSIRSGDEIKFDLAGNAWSPPCEGWRDTSIKTVHRHGGDQYVALTGDRAVNTVWFWLDDGADIGEVGMPFAICCRRARTTICERQVSCASCRSRRSIERLLSLIVGTGSGDDRSCSALPQASVLKCWRAEASSARSGISGSHAGKWRRCSPSKGRCSARWRDRWADRGHGDQFDFDLGREPAIVPLEHDLSAPVGLLSGLSIALIGAAALIAVVSGRQAMGGEVVRAVREDW